MRSRMVRFLTLGLLMASYGASTESQLWHLVNLNPMTLAAGESIDIGYLSRLSCAIHATRSPSADLFCHNNGQCSLSDLKVSADHDDSVHGSNPNINCWTRHVCALNGVGLAEGEETFHNCVPKICLGDKVVNSYQAKSACTHPFEEVPGVGCFSLQNESMSWCNARIKCSQLGGDLAVPDDFVSFKDHFSSAFWLDKHAWLGAKERKWIDGTDITSSSWYPTEPNGPSSDCIRVGSKDLDIGLFDGSCQNNYVFLCGVKI